jgi:endoglucanase
LQDKCAGYPEAATPDEMYIDHDYSYASNEIAINPDAPFVYLASAIEALQAKIDLAKK